MLEKITNKLKQEGFISTFLAIILFPIKVTKSRLEFYKMLRTPSIKNRFEQIYKKNYWSSEESVSGEGSEIGYTKNLREWLILKLSDLNVKKIVDAPCGDFNWMKEVIPKLEVTYQGLDIVDSVIETNKSLYESADVKFSVADICADTLPDCDLLIARDFLFHLSYEHIDMFLENLSNTDYKYLLTTSHIIEDGYLNKDIATGSFRLIDLFSSPFNFNPESVVDKVKDYPQGYKIPREMILIEKRNVPVSLSL